MKRRRLAITAALTATAIAATLLALPLLRPQCALVKGSERVTISISRLLRGSASFFCYRDDAGQRLRFILARDTQGKVHGVFDACRQCYHFHKGYTTSGGYLICRLCGNRYALADIQAGKASCVPVSIPIEQTGDAVRVKVADLRGGRALF
jgi:uncharacterized membrane protein